MNKVVFKFKQFTGAFRYLRVLGFSNWLIFVKALMLNDKNGIKIKPKESINRVKLRGHYVDRNVFDYVFFEQFHLPDDRIVLPKEPTILDLGSNIGLTLCHFNYLYPNARIVGYEMDQDNFKLASENIEELHNVSLQNAAVWTEDGVIEYNKEAKNDSFSINSQRNHEGGRVVSVSSVSIKSIIKNNGLDKIDYLKMDIEGAEKDILKSGKLDWLKSIKAMNLELHLDKGESIEEFKSILEAHGFEVWVDHRHWSSLMAKANH